MVRLHSAERPGTPTSVWNLLVIQNLLTMRVSPCITKPYALFRYISLMSLAVQGHPVFSIKIAILQTHDDLFPRLRLVIAAMLSIVLSSVFARS